MKTIVSLQGYCWMESEVFRKLWILEYFLFLPVTKAHHKRLAICIASNLKVQRDYYKAIQVVMQMTQPIRQDIIEFDKKGIMNNCT